MPQCFEKRVTARHRILFRRRVPGLKRRQPAVDALHEQIMVTVFVSERLARPAAALPHLVGQLHHLVNRLPAVQAHDKLFYGRCQLAVRFGRLRAAKDLDHHGNHDLRPPFTDERQRPVEVEEYGTKPAARQVGIQDFDLVVEHALGRVALPTGVLGELMQPRSEYLPL